jgi:hypothetical protein
MTTFVPLHPTPKRRDRPNVGWLVLPNGCHEWQGGQNGGGYGKVWWEGKKWYIHRLRYEMEFGPVPEGMVLDHYACNNRKCCNPTHVRPVTIRENVLRSSSPAALCATKTHCKNGHPLVEGNLVPAGVRRGQRMCRTCHNARSRKHKSST